MLAHIHYTLNYAIKIDCCQYQRVMIVAIVRKTFDDHNNNITTAPSNYTPNLDKFALKAVNRLSYNQEISGLLVASYLLNLLNHYFPKVIVKIINITLLQAKFSLIWNGKRLY